MSGVKLSENAIRLMVVILSLLGIAILVLIAAFSDVQDVELSEVGDHNGEAVRTEGMVVGQDIGPSGSSSILIADRDGNTIEISIESRSYIEVEPGETVSAKGDVFSTGQDVTLNLQTDSGIDVMTGSEPSNLDERGDPWQRISGEGMVVSMSSRGWYGSDITMCYKNGGDLEFFDVDLSGTDGDVRSGDVIKIDGIVWNDGTVRCYGSRSISVIYRPESVTETLLGLISDLSESPSNIPSGKADIVAYVVYEPSSSSLFVSDEVQGSSISLKARNPDWGGSIHMGDMVKLVNTTLFWDSDGLRYVLIPEWIEVMVSHGPWNLNIDNLDYGISRYEGAEVAIRGDLIAEGSSSYLMSGNSSIEVRSMEPLGTEFDVLVTGRVCYDTRISSHFIELLECAGC